MGSREGAVEKKKNDGMEARKGSREGEEQLGSS